MGTAALNFVVTLGLAAPASGAPVRVVQGEGMQVRAGAVVRDAQAAGGRAVALRPAGVASATFVSDAFGAVVLRVRASRCERARSLSVSVDGGARHAIVPRAGWHEQRVRLALPAGRHAVEVAYTGPRRSRCRALVDRLRLPAPRPAKPAVEAPPAPAATPLRRPVPLGASVQARHFDDPGYEAAFRREFASMTPENEMKMEIIQPQPGVFNFGPADELVTRARQAGKAVRGHALVFGTQTPPWVGRLLLPSDAEAALRDHITTVMEHFDEDVREWDVVNEALGPDGSYRSNPWFDKLGPRYVELAFRIAREVDPKATLVYNEFAADVSGIKRDATANLVRGLKEKGLVDAVGLQMHHSLATAPTREALESTMRMYEQMGVQVQVTEMDVIAGGPGALSDRLNIQADAYRRAAETCAAVRACTRFTVWGVSDAYSWMGVDELPLLLDASNQPKPALAAVRDVLG